MTLPPTPSPDPAKAAPNPGFGAQRPAFSSRDIASALNEQQDAAVARPAAVEMTPEDSDDRAAPSITGAEIRRLALARPRNSLPVPLWVIGLAVLAAVGGGTWLQVSRTKPVAVAVVPAATEPPPPAVVVPTAVKPAMVVERPVRLPLTIKTAGERQILENTIPPDAGAQAQGGGDPNVAAFHFAPNPRILVLDFASLRDQGLMLNRAAAFVEKAGLPHTRLLGDDALNAAIAAGGDTIETFYYGHDYGATAMVRFFARADQDNFKLSDHEMALRELLRMDGWFNPNSKAALISIPQPGADEHVTMAARSTILHHELSHGEYFTNPAYAAYVHRFWTQSLTTAEQEQIRTHLRSLGYDTTLEDVMENEAQAYLMFTENPDFFKASMVGMSDVRVAALRTNFHRNMPAGWLRDSLGQSLNPTTRSAPR